MAKHYVPAAETEHDTAAVEDFRRRAIRGMGGLRITTDLVDYVDLVDLDAVLDILRALPALTA